MEERLHAWCDAVLGYIRFKPDRSRIREELEAHLEDKLERLTSQGMDREAAAERAVLEMGDPEVVGKALDQAHKRLLGWAWLLSKICAVGLALLLSCQLVISGRHTRENLWERLRQQFQPIVYEQVGLYFDPEGEPPGQDFTFGGLGSEPPPARSCGYILSVPYGIWWDWREGELETEWIQLALTARRKLPWEEPPWIWKELRVLDDTGRQIRFIHDPALQNQERIANYYTYYTPNPQRSMGEVVYYMLIHTDRLTDWVELSYPHGENDWTLRVERRAAS